MKKIIIIAGIISALGIISCGSNQKGTDPAQDSSASHDVSGTRIDNNNGDNPRASVNDESLQQGATLVANNDCKTCHEINKKIVGPSYNDIANKYTNNEGYRDELAYKIVQGGSGRWGTVAMPAHPNVSIPEAREMARYILSLHTGSK
jgi:cytochrome c